MIKNNGNTKYNECLKVTSNNKYQISTFKTNIYDHFIHMTLCGLKGYKSSIN